MRAALPALALCVAVAACRPAGPRPDRARPEPPPAALPEGEPVVRVGVLVEADAAEVGASTPFTVRAGDAVLGRGEPDERWTVTADGDAVQLRAPDGAVRTADGPVTVEPRPGGTVWIGERRYRGTAVVRAAEGGRVTAVNVLALEDYLLGVVPREIGRRPASEIEAVKAQAVAARTYAVSNLGGRESLGFDYYGSVSDQAYGGREVEDETTRRAVRETRGEIVAYRGRPILAFYHSTCGGRTANVEEVWRRGALPYLRSVSDRVPGTRDRWYCDSSNRFRWTERWSRSALVTTLVRTLGRHLGVGERPFERVGSIEVEGRTTSGRAQWLRIDTSAGRHRVRGDSIRWVLRPEPGRILNSAWIELQADRRDGWIEALAVTGRGWGHGVGMCQVGAIGRARAGQSYRTILTTYYTDTRIERLY